MLQEYDAYEAQVVEKNGNKDSLLALTEKSYSENKELQDTEAPKKLLKDFSHMLKERASFFMKLKKKAGSDQHEVDQ